MSKSQSASHSHDDLKKYALSLLEATSHVTDHKVAEARERLNKIIDNIGEGVEEAEQVALKKVKQARNFVRENPYKSAAIIVGVFTLLALAMKLRKSD